MPEERLQKILAHAGVASRRHAEQLMLAGLVTVNGAVVTELGTKADPERDHIKVEGKLILKPEKHVYLAVYKPDGYVTTVSDPEGRRTVMDLIKSKERVYPVGRLDYHSEGLLLMTNDGEFANRITAAKYHVPKTYAVKVNGPLTAEQMEQFRSGVPLHGKRTAPAAIKVIKPARNPWYEVTLTEGRQNQIRLMFQFFGRLVERLRRIQIGFLELDLPPGKFRSLTPREVDRFRKILKLTERVQ